MRELAGTGSCDAFVSLFVSVCRAAEALIRTDRMVCGVWCVVVGVWLVVCGLWFVVCVSIVSGGCRWLM